MESFKENKQYIIELLEEIFHKQIVNINFEGTEQFNEITEYNFSLLKANITYKSEEKDEVYLKMIKGGKIKESIFCYWSLLYDEFLENNQSNIENMLQKAIITQITSNEIISSLLLTLNSKCNYCAEITLVELKSFFEKNKSNERWSEKLEIKKDDILFIGRKLY